MPTTVFDGRIGVVAVKAVVDDLGYSDVSSDAGDTHVVVSSNYRGVFTIVASDGGTDAEQKDFDDRVEFRVGDRVLATVRSEQRCGGGSVTVTDFAGNVLLSVSNFLGAMCAGFTVSTVNDLVLTKNDEKYRVEGDYAVTEFRITLPDGKVVEKSNVRPVEKE